MSTAAHAQVKNVDKGVKSPVEIANDLKNDCEVSSSSKVVETKSVQKDRTKNKTETPNTKSDNKMSADQTNRNPLTETATTPSNTEPSRKNSSGSENKTPKSGANEANNNNNVKLRARAAKRSPSPTQMPACGWCSDRKPHLKYKMPTLSGENLQFCSVNCIGEFRKAEKKGACKRCGNAVRMIIAPNKEYCSTFCMNKAMPKNGMLMINQFQSSVSVGNINVSFHF